MQMIIPQYQFDIILIGYKKNDILLIFSESSGNYKRCRLLGWCGIA